VGAQVVGDDDPTGSQGRHEGVADVPREASAGHPAIEPHQGADPVARERRDDGLVLARIAWRRRVCPLTTRRPGVRRRVAEVAAGLVEEVQIVAERAGTSARQLSRTAGFCSLALSIFFCASTRVG
jgi:hypothetical protein